jgi:hypothetical protein
MNWLLSRAKKAETERDALRGEVAMLRDVMDSIRVYGQDTLSGRADGPDDREWQRAGVLEMTKRAHAALTATEATEKAYRAMKESEE